jgi:uncharacterized protein YjbI with pentapeptide repeats
MRYTLDGSESPNRDYRNANLAGWLLINTFVGHDFSGANLRNATLKGKFIGVKFTGADLTYADTSEAIFTNCIFG